ncbi:uncharacterized protein LOC124539103 [Vanessa cardui]|uniref:uncharacterized protein LOC124539103 n=1 Tax=Vanessa cardui TaxID=171605 RepID=UPI001F142027|nr:uncharacterized protein LOC124539103 [Vanessa cardui]
MARLHRILQANTNHCKAAQDLLVQTFAEWLVDVAVVAEPYSVPRNWLGDEDSSVALVARSSTDSPPISLIEKGPGYVAAAWGDIALIGVYFSPNRPLVDFESFLGVLAMVAGRAEQRRVLVVGDLNAKSVVWGNRSTDARGREVELWSVASGLSLLNRGTVHTCVRREGGSIVDLAFATPSLATHVVDWRVELVETLSDHRYVRFDVSIRGSRGTRTGGQPPFPRWALTRLDQEAAGEAAFVQDWLTPPVDIRGVRLLDRGVQFQHASVSPPAPSTSRVLVVRGVGDSPGRLRGGQEKVHQEPAAAPSRSRQRRPPLRIIRRGEVRL